MRRPLRILLVPLAIAVVLPACSGPAQGGSRGRGSDGPPTPQPAVSSPSPCSDRAEHPFVVTMRDDRFVPSCLVVSGAVPFHLRNRGSQEHNLTIPGTGFSVDVGPGHTLSRPALVRSHVPPGTYRFFCRFHRSRGMSGELHVLAA
ncbi:MAG: cupredoxin domain-containing protein [Actinomycetota bacterium]